MVDTVSIEADVYDDVDVIGVEFRVDAEPVAFFTGPPFSFALPAGQSVGKVTVAAENLRGLISNQSLELTPCGI